ncbi:MAG: efflux RND transporter periplasmic adaptor subunit, partial [Myxococcaceae bacterium]
RPGMTANVTFVYADKAEVLRVPNSALRFTPAPELLARARGETGRRAGRRPGGSPAQPSKPSAPPPAASGQRVVWVLRDKAPAEERIGVGVSDGSYTEVTSGQVREGEKVVTGAAPGAEPGGQPPRGFRMF